VAELYEGVFRSRNLPANENALKDFLSALTILNLDEQTCRVYGQEKTRLIQRGTVIGALDLLIAATALAHNLVLLTADHDFERVENLSITFLAQ
jgi:tRNA(fMet)-specific endonuclease VapC